MIVGICTWHGLVTGMNEKHSSNRFKTKESCPKKCLVKLQLSDWSTE